tara:strand:- start:918 stop:2441 length:1524 start_codon:yes stop_codon:yes gene_type:complete
MATSPLAMTGQSNAVPAPIGGLNTRDSVDLLPETDAIRLENFFPARSHVQVRNGYDDHVTGLPSTVQSLMVYNSGTTSTMFAASGTAVYDVTSAGSVGSAVITSLSNAQFQWVNMTTSGGSFLWICNGADAPRHWNGSAWATPTLGSITAANVINVEVFKERLFLVLKDSLTYGYLPVNSVAGTVASVNLGSVFSKGGKLMAISTWTRDGGSGPDDNILFYTDQGEIAMYSGTDPSDATKWSLVGVYTVGRPIGRRCMLRVGSDCYLVTENGLLPMTQVLGTGEAAPNRAISDKISNSYNDSVVNFKDVFGWQGVVYPKGGYAAINVPDSNGGAFIQYVVNLDTGAWAKFTNQNAYVWVVFNSDLYFGGDTKVHKADSGTDDAGSAIEAIAKTAFIYFGGRGGPKRFTAIRPVMASDTTLEVSVGFDTDFRDGTTTFTPSTTSSIASAWDTATWDAATWGAPITTQQAWFSVADIGWNAAVRVRTSTSQQSVRWLATDVRYEVGVGL